MKKFNNFADLPAFWETLDTTALVYEEEGEQKSLSYRELGKKIIQRSGALRQGNSAVAALKAEATPEFIISLFANVIAGVTVLIADPRMPEQIVQTTIEKASNESQPEGKILFYTSGTSNRSRCVVLTPQSLLCSAWSGQCMLSCGPEDTILCLLPLSHVFGFVCGMLWGLCYGAAIALGRGVRHLFDDCLYYHPTILPAVPAIADALDRMKLFNPELRVLLVGAAPCGEALLESIRKKGIDVYYGYGLTETSSGIAITQDLEEPSAMYPCPGADIRIEEDGEISVATPCMMEGYLGEESPLVDGRLLTGDLGQFDEQGRLHITGRRKDMIVMPDGTKIFCPEYEAVLMQRLETNAIALAEFRNRAVLVVEEAGPLVKDVKEAVRHFNQDRSRSQQIADVIYLKDKFPRTALGKLQRWELKSMLENTFSGKSSDSGK